MATRPDSVFYGVYDEYVGEPRTKPEVYGYWVLVVGVLALLLGGGLALGDRLAGLGVPGPTVLVATLVLGGGGVVCLLLGLVLQLPLRRRGTLTALAGGLVALTALAGGVTTGLPTLSTTPGLVAAVAYGGGLTLVVLVGTLTPVVTGRRCLLLPEEPPEYLSWTLPEDDAESNVSTVMLGDATQDGVFAVFPAEDGWRWWFVEQTAVADGRQRFETATDAEDALEGVRSTVADANLLEINHPAIRVYQGVEGSNVRWALVDGDGVVLADSEGTYADPETAENAVNLFKEYGPGAALLDAEDGAFEVYSDGSTWQWRLVDEDRGVLGTGAAGHDERTEAEAAVLGVREAVQDAPSMNVTDLGFELLEDDGEWHWRLVDAADTVLAEPTTTYQTEEGARAAIGYVADHAIDVPFVAADTPGYEVVEADDGGWCWRLVDGGDEVVARSQKAVPSAESGRSVVDRVKSVVDGATVAHLEDAAFEVYADGDDWGWRLVTEDRDCIAENPSSVTYETEAAATAAVDRVRTEIEDAEQLTFDSAAFHLYEAEEGTWNWRLVDADGSVVSDSGQDHDSRDDAASAMSTMKEHAPEAELVEMESAALECYQDDDEWHWRLVDASGETLARSPTRYESVEAARDAMDSLALLAPDASARTMDAALFEVFVSDTEPRQWRWRLVHPDGAVLARSEAGFAGQDEATAAAETVADYAGDAPEYTIAELAIRFSVETVETGEDEDQSVERWHWDCIDQDREQIAVGTEQFQSRDAVADTARLVRDRAGAASVFEVDPAAFRLEESDEGWRWRLVDPERATLAVGGRTHETREAANADVERVRELAGGAGLLDFDLAAFEVVEREGGWVWQFVDTEGSVIGVSAQTFDSATAAERALSDVRELLTAASVLEIESPAFELHVEGGEWRWRLVAVDGSTIAESMRTYPTRREARQALASLRSFGPDAATESHA